MAEKKKKKRNISFTIGAILVIIVVVIFLISLVYMPHDPNLMNLTHKFLKPGEDELYRLGTDHFGRDILSRLMFGARHVLLVGVVSVAIGAVIGFILGAAAGMLKGLPSQIIMRVMDGLISFPSILLAMMMITIIGRGTKGSIVAVALFMVPSFARLVYSLVLDNKELLFVKAAKSYGMTNRQILFKHLIPIILPRLITQFTASIGAAIIIETSLSFLGLGVQAPNASWGLMLADAKKNFLVYPYLAYAPGIAIAITVLGFNLLGDGLNEVLLNKKREKISFIKKRRTSK
ncbi:MAG: ABC transporter permease [Firmicutes bacterium]|nr:ABC transporter permease [Bacillota bacterium]MBQ7242422.1 ABC transporter permease [Bacillota bacterium]MBR0105033.1 ABC transporter permease [Bacillota bacterium]MBR2594664.1 ABC transporter permease [Bacillota bacterium]